MSLKVSKEEFVWEFARKNKMRMLLRAYLLACYFHRKHKRDDRTPYVVHPIELCYVLIVLGIKDERLLCIAMTHDVPEELRDRSGILIKEEDLAVLLDASVAKGVFRLTKPGRKMDENELRHFFGEIEKDPGLVLVKTDDRYVNMRRSMFGVFKEERMRKYYFETNEFILPMSERIIDEGRCPEYENALRMLRSGIKGLLEGVRAQINLREGGRDAI